MTTESRRTRLVSTLKGTRSRISSRFDLSDAALALVCLAVAVVLGAGLFLAKVGQDVVAGDGLEVRDAGELTSLVSHRSPWLVELAGDVTRVGAVGVLAVVALLVGALLWLRGARLAVALVPLASLLVTGAVVAVTKQLVGRARPPMGLRLAVDTEPSFPSGHSADSAALFVAVGIVIAAVVLRRPLARAAMVLLGLALSGAIGLSRLVLGAHWPTDVLAGWALGTLVAVGVTTVVLVAVRATPAPPARDGLRRSVRSRALAVLRWQRRDGHASAAT